MKKLIALTLIAAGALATGSPEIQPGQAFETSDDLATALIGTGEAKLDDRAASASAPAPVTKTKSVKVRLLTDNALGSVNDVVTLTASEAKSAEAGGIADTTPAAVAYAMTLPQNQA